jgi:hypothetical protein
MLGYRRPHYQSSMHDIPRAILLPPPASPPQRFPARDAEGSTEAARGTRRQAQAAPQSAPGAFLTLVDSRREDTVEIKGKQFRFRPYGSRGASAEEITREAGHRNDASEPDAIGFAASEQVSVEILDGFGAGARQRNSSAFIASFIAQERLQQGLHNPPFEAASFAYRRAGGSPSAPDGQARVVSLAI